jgi:hypothetical protein
MAIFMMGDIVLEIDNGRIWKLKGEISGMWKEGPRWDSRSLVPRCHAFHPKGCVEALSATEVH